MPLQTRARRRLEETGCDMIYFLKITHTQHFVFTHSCVSHSRRFVRARRSITRPTRSEASLHRLANLRISAALCHTSASLRCVAALHVDMRIAAPTIILPQSSSFASASTTSAASATMTTLLVVDLGSWRFAKSSTLLTRACCRAPFAGCLRHRGRLRIASDSASTNSRRMSTQHHQSSAAAAGANDADDSTVDKAKARSPLRSLSFSVV